MASTSETGHAKNVSNFENLIVCVISLRANYSPNKLSLQLPQLEALLAQAQHLLSDVTDKRSEYRVKVNERQAVFAGLKSLSTRLISALKNSDADERLIEDAKSFHLKMHGRRAATKEKTGDDIGATAIARNSVSQQSYTQLIQHLDGLISILRRAPAYNPTQSDLQIASLLTLKTELNQKTRAVMDAESDWVDARTIRDNTFYKGPNSLVEIAAAVKSEIKSTFGVNSPEFTKANKCAFKTIG